MYVSVSEPSRSAEATGRGTAGRRSAGSALSSRPKASTRSHIVVSHLRLLAFLKGSEAVGERNHAVAGERVVLYVFDIVAGDIAEDALALSQDVVDR